MPEKIFVKADLLRRFANGRVEVGIHRTAPDKCSYYAVLDSSDWVPIPGCPECGCKEDAGKAYGGHDPKCSQAIPF